MTNQQLAERIVNDCMDYLQVNYPKHHAQALEMASMFTKMAVVLIEDEGLTAVDYTPQAREDLLGAFDKSFRFSAGLA